MAPRTVRALPLLVAGALSIAACSSSEGSGDGTAPESTPTAVTSAEPAGTTTAAEPDTSENTTQSTDSAPSDSTAPETTPLTEPPVDELPTTDAPVDTTTPPSPPILRADGLGPLEFGRSDANQAEAALIPFFGAATTVTGTSYSDDRGTYFENSVVEEGFSYPYGSSYCYVNELCLYFGGDGPASEVLVGYRQSQHPDSLATASEVTAGSAGADFATVIVMEAGGCFSTGGGTADGVSLLLRSDGVMFSEYNEADATFTNTAPPVADVTVLDVYAGEEPFYLFDDC